jgi:hypothetical protein
MKTTTRGAITTLTAILLAATAWLSPAAAMPNLKNLLLGWRRHAEAAGRHLSLGLLAAALAEHSTGLSDVSVRWTDTSPADTSTLIERANSPACGRRSPRSARSTARSRTSITRCRPTRSGAIASVFAAPTAPRS